jgi:spore coat protein U-like protein
MRFSKLLLALTTIGGLAVGSDSSIWAATATANLGISTTVSANCTIAVTTQVVFPAYDPVGTNATANDDTTGVLSVTCTKGAGVSVGLGLGANATGTQPRMKGPGATDFLNYMLYSDSTRTTPWSNATYAIGPAPNKTARSFTVYARIPSGQDISTGTYADTVVATVNF